MKRLRLPIVLGVAHGIADGTSALLLASLTHQQTLAKLGALILLYNGLAFGLQPAVGLLVDRLQRPKAAALAGLSLLGLAAITFFWQAELSVIIAGIGSAFFHVGGGALALGAAGGRADGAGFFTAPGVLGLGCGTLLGLFGNGFFLPATFLLATSTFAIARFAKQEAGQQRITSTAFQVELQLQETGLLALLFLMAIAARSAVWNMLQLVYRGQNATLLALAVAAFAGKLLGGICADKIGWRNWSAGALVSANIFLLIAANHQWALLIGVALFQSTTPVLLCALARCLPENPATASGLALGLAIAFGGMWSFREPGISGEVFSLCLMSASLLVWLAFRLSKGVHYRLPINQPTNL